MKLSKLSIAITSALMAATAVTAFIPSPSSLSLNLLPTTRGLSVSATFEDIELEDTAAVRKLTFRELQSACKKKGLPAVGNTATLRNRLLETLPTFVNEADPTPEIIEVPTVSLKRLYLYLSFLISLYHLLFLIHSQEYSRNRLSG